MATYQRSLEELDEMGLTVIGATVEDRDTAAKMAEEEGLTFPIAYGVTEETVAALAPWWTEDKAHGRYLQPMEFLVSRGVVLGSMYASGPIGRMGVRQAMAFIKFRESRQRQASAAASS